MPSATDRLEFAPPRAKGSPRAFALAVFVHILLIAALTWGVNWKRSDEAASFEAELWTSVPQQAAPRLVEVSPPMPAPVPTPAPPPPPAKAPEVRVSPAVPDADIALELEKKRKLQQQLKQAEAQKAEKLREKLEAELQAKKEKEQEKQKLAAAAAEKQKQSAAASEKARQDNIKRMMGQAGATGAADAKGSAQKSSGPSASYGGKVRARVLPNVVFTEDIAGNPTAEVEVRTTADGAIMSQRLVKSSGNKAWDDAVIKAIVRTGSMPRDVDGRVPTPMILEFRPKD